MGGQHSILNDHMRNKLRKLFCLVMGHQPTYGKLYTKTGIYEGGFCNFCFIRLKGGDIHEQEASGICESTGKD